MTRIAASARALAEAWLAAGSVATSAAAAASGSGCTAFFSVEPTVSRLANAGKRKANVLPEPVGETPTRSVGLRPSSSDQHSDWIAVVAAAELGRLSVETHASTSTCNCGSTFCLTSSNVVANLAP